MNKYRNNAGFSLIELLIAVVVIGILVAISVIGYNAVIKGTKDSLQTFRLTDYAKAQENFKVVKGKRRYATLTELCQAKLLPENIVKFDGACGTQSAINGWVIVPSDDGDTTFLRTNFRAVLKKENHTQSDGPIYCINADGVLRKSVASDYLECIDDTPPAE
jgi:prepilin-type N-terminal cleavage/methylation domain-containing protein